MVPAPLVSLDRVDVVRDGHTVLRDITWQLRRGEHWGIVGANGSGKSTLLGLIAGTLWPAPERGTRRYDFGAGAQTDAVQARSRIAVVSHELQDRYARLGGNFTALDIVLSGAYRTDVPRRRPSKNEEIRAGALLDRLRVADLAQRRFLELSRGQQRRVLIARALAFEPVVLLLDEPASGLDRRAREELAATLESLAADVTIVCTAHHHDDLPAFIARTLTILDGRAIEDRRARSETASFAASAAAAAHTELEDTAAHPATADRDRPLIELVHADVWLGAHHVLRSVDWRLRPGEHWLITGANGSGKSTFLRLLHGQLRPALGTEIHWPALGDPRNVWRLRRDVAWVAPELQADYRYPSSVHDCIASGFESSVGLTRALTEAEQRRVGQLLERFDLTALAARPLSSLSYGQTRRALIARALVNSPRVLLLDEPWEGLDGASAELLNRSLMAVIADETQLVSASHLAAHRELFTHELVLEKGRIVRAGKRR
jgi:molybdate transport system ATP-binding protein